MDNKVIVNSQMNLRYLLIKLEFQKYVELEEVDSFVKNVFKNFQMGSSNLMTYICNITVYGPKEEERYCIKFLIVYHDNLWVNTSIVLKKLQYLRSLGQMSLRLMNKPQYWSILNAWFTMREELKSKNPNELILFYPKIEFLTIYNNPLPNRKWDEGGDLK